MMSLDESWYESHGYVENKVLTGAIHVPKRDQYLKERGDDHAVHTRILPDYMKKQEKKKVYCGCNGMKGVDSKTESS